MASLWQKCIYIILMYARAILNIYSQGSSGVCCPESVILELGTLGSTGERDDIADVLHTSDEENEPFEAQSEASMWA